MDTFKKHLSAAEQESLENSLNEMPMVIPDWNEQVIVDWLKSKAQKLITKENISNLVKFSTDIVTGSPSIDGTGLYVYVPNLGKETAKPTGAVLMAVHRNNDLDQLVLYPKASASFESGTNVMLNVYKAISSKSGVYIASDDKQTTKAKNQWLKLLEHPNKFGVLDIFVYDTQKQSLVVTNSPEKYWSPTTKTKRYIILAKWKP